MDTEEVDRKPTLLLEYENQIYLDMFHSDALLILAEGLGIERIFLNFIRLYCDPCNLVLIVNTSDADDEYFTSRLKKETTGARMNPSLKLTKITNETHTVSERVQAYLQGGCFFVTSRILVVDMLTDRIPIDLISGILVYKAHMVIDSCQESFIMRMYRQKNKKGFIKAFSDNPIFFSKSSSKVDRIMKNLFVKKLFIFPRFHVNIESELSRHKPEVIEIQVALSENSARTQMALLDILNVLLQEFKGCCTYIDHDFLTMEMVISKPFDKVVKAQLEPVWNQLGSKPKQLINDIKTLRLLLYYLIQYDCVTFYKMLNCVKSHEKELGRSSGWMFLDAANELFTRARLRVYGTHLKSYTKFDPSNKKQIMKLKREMAERIVEESPKLKALKEVLEEIAVGSGDTVNVLILANDDRTVTHIQHFLRRNSLTTGGRDDRKKSKKKSKQHQQPSLIDVVRSDGGQGDDNGADGDEFVVKMMLKPLCADDEKNDADGRFKQSNLAKMHKQTTSAKDKKQAAKSTKSTNSKATSKSSSNINERSTLEDILLNDDDDDDDGDDNDDSSSTSSTSDSDEDDNATAKTSPKTASKTHLLLSAFEGGDKQRLLLVKLLYETNPAYVVLFDSQLWFVRQLEVYKALHFNDPMRIYFLMYTNSCEEQRYLTSIRSEKESFEILIRQKATMIVEVEQDGKGENTERRGTVLSIQAQAANTRLGGGAVKTGAEAENDDEAARLRIIVDMREFRSELPSVLHKRGFHIEPVTLEVGDYVITPSICVERKSINDLIESLHNGRLYNQCNAMSRSYKTPVLLIEFDRNKPFQLNSYQTVTTNDLSAQHISSKLVLLTMNFPKLRILWCSSPNETAEIFEELKSGCPQPDAQTAMAIKSDQIKEAENIKYNSVLMDLLLKIPGIHSKNLHRVLNKVANLYDLCQMSETELTDVLENSNDAKAAYEFLNKTRKDTTNEAFGFDDLQEFLQSKQTTKISGKLTEKATATTTTAKKTLVTSSSSNKKSKK